MEQIKVDYAEYPKIIERAQLLSDLVIELGYIYLMKEEKEMDK